MYGCFKTECPLPSLRFSFPYQEAVIDPDTMMIDRLTIFPGEDVCVQIPRIPLTLHGRGDVIKVNDLVMRSPWVI